MVGQPAANAAVITATAASAAPQEAPTKDRQTICYPHHNTEDVLQPGDAGFTEETTRHFPGAEAAALEALIDLKAKLRACSTDDFFANLTEGMSTILGAEICFVMKRVLVDDQDSAVEMPPIGEPGSCLMAAALHCSTSNDGTGTRHTVKSTKYAAWDCPCAYMRHDKIFLIPNRLGDFITRNPNQLPYPCEAYIAVPLRAEGKCFAHFGAMWSTEAATSRALSWAVIELILHSLEDMVLARLLEGSPFSQNSSGQLERTRVIPHAAVSVAQSLRPYAGSLSHELRTPMQGVVGMLDVMYATVQEAVESQVDPKLQEVFATLRENIEAVQDSSRRAVEAADNVVHAYDMDMTVPDGPVELVDDSVDLIVPPQSATTEKRPEILVAGSNLPMSRPQKRRREDVFSNLEEAQLNKVPRLMRSASACRCGDGSQNVSSESETRSAANPQTPPETDYEINMASRTIMPGLRYTDFRELIKHVITDGLKSGGRPDSAMAQETEHGETIEIRIRRSDGTVGTKFIEWAVDPNVPQTIFIEEMDLSKLLSRVFLNAIKFTDNLSGRIQISARVSTRGRYISVKVTDNGPGIPAAFLPRLFKAFSQEDASLTRSSEGLGLGLMVAKGIARKIGGDLTCNRTATEGPDRGTQFEIKVPLHAGESLSRPTSPFGSPLPRHVQPAGDIPPAYKPLPPSSTPAMTYQWTQAIHDSIGEGSLSDAALHSSQMPTTPPTPPSPRSIVNAELPKPPTSQASVVPPAPPAQARPRPRKPVTSPDFDRELAKKYPLTFLIAEDNKINRKLLVSMLSKFGYKNIYEAHDGAEAVRQMSKSLAAPERIDVVLMDLWMPLMDGYEATERILQMGLADVEKTTAHSPPTVLAVTADVTDAALERAASVGMKGFMSKPYKLMDLQRLITEYCASSKVTAPPTAASMEVAPV